MRSQARTITALLATLSLAACGGDDNNNPGTGPGGASGTFSVTMSGGVTGTFSGSAVQAEVVVDPNVSQQGWAMAMLGDNSTSNIMYLLRIGDRPGTGTFQLVDLSTGNDLQQGQMGALLIADAGGPSFFGESVSGTVTITSSSTDRVEGSLNVQLSGATSANPGMPVAVGVTGNFNAIGSTVGLPGG